MYRYWAFQRKLRKFSTILVLYGRHFHIDKKLTASGRLKLFKSSYASIISHFDLRIYIQIICSQLDFISRYRTFLAIFCSHKNGYFKYKTFEAES